MTSPPTVTAIITFWNRADYLAEAAESVLTQELPADGSLKLVMVDDGSDDDSPAVANRFVPPARVVRQENRGAAGAANTGIREARGEFVAFCDSDDVWLPGKLDAQLRAAHDGHDVVFGHLEEFLSPELDPAAVRTRALRPPSPGYVPSCALVRRELFDRLGLFDETLANGAWVEWYTRVRGAGLDEFVVDQVVTRRRIHEHNSWASHEQGGVGYLRALRSWVHEQREDPGRGTT